MNLIIKTIELFLTGVESILRLLLHVAESIVESADDNKKYKAKFASSWSLLSHWNFGFNITGKDCLSVKKSYENSLIIASTGMGKTSVVLIPSIFTMKGSFVIHDPTGENFLHSSGYLSHSHGIKVLNFSNPNISCGFNPLTRAVSNSDIQKIASMLIENALGGSGSHKEPFWNIQGVSLLSMIIAILKKQEPEYQNLFNARHLLNMLSGSPEAVDNLFSKYADEILFAEYKSFVNYDDKVISGVIATCKAALQIFNDPSVAKVTSFDNLNMEEFREKPTALFIQNSVADQKYYSVITSIFFEQFFSYIMSRFTLKGEQDVFFLIDEASSLKLPTLQLSVANVRKHSAGIMLIIQDLNQLINNYGKNEADAIRANCFAKLYFSGASLETAKELEQTLGKFEYRDKDKNKVVRSLMTNDEIRTMKANRALLICGHYLPIKVKLTPYYKNRKFNEYSRIPPAAIESCIPATIPLLNLKKSHA